MSDLDPIEDGQAECRFCGEWYRITAPYGGHCCCAKAERDRLIDLIHNRRYGAFSHELADAILAAGYRQNHGITSDRGDA